MDRIKEFFGNITKTGWIIVSLAIVVVLLIIIGILSARSGSGFLFLNKVKEPTPEFVEYGNEEILANVERAMESAKDSVLSVEDVLSGKYGNDYESATIYVRNTVEVPVAVFRSLQKQEGGLNNVCGEIEYVITRIPSKPAVVNETLKALFSENVTTDFEPGNIIFKEHKGLIFDNATIDSDGVLEIYLRGEFNENAVCGFNSAVSQIEYTVNKLDTVKKIEIYLNLNLVN